MLNAKTIDAKIKTATKAEILIDGSGERGAGRLAIRIRPTAQATRADWLAIWWTAGRRKTATIGRYPDLSLSAARDLFRQDWRGAIIAGQDPRHARRRSAEAGTVADLIDGYLADLRDRGRRTTGEAARILSHAADAIGRDMRAADVTVAAIRAHLAAIHGRGAAVAADRARATLHAAFSWGLRHDGDYTRPAGRRFDLTVNPVAGIRRDASAARTRDRVLDADELRDLMLAIGARNGFDWRTAAAVEIVLNTGCRVQEALRAEIDDFDLAAKAWTIPASKSKTGRARVVPMTDALVARVIEIRRMVGKGHIFLNDRQPGQIMPHQSVNRALARWTASRGSLPMQARDLRRSWATWAAEIGISKDARKAIMGHADGGDVHARHYDRADMLAITRPAIEAWGRYLARVTRGKGQLLRVI